VTLTGVACLPEHDAEFRLRKAERPMVKPGTAKTKIDSGDRIGSLDPLTSQESGARAPEIVRPGGTAPSGNKLGGAVRSIDKPPLRR